MSYDEDIIIELRHRPVGSLTDSVPSGMIPLATDDL